jgi:hypothetical protein
MHTARLWTRLGLIAALCIIQQSQAGWSPHVHITYLPLERAGLGSGPAEPVGQDGLLSKAAAAVQVHEPMELHPHNVVSVKSMCVSGILALLGPCLPLRNHDPHLGFATFVFKIRFPAPSSASKAPARVAMLRGSVAVTRDPFLSSKKLNLMSDFPFFFLWHSHRA